ncbi:ribonuclease H-like domain-containing protein [Tanacetum coccineum]
MFQLDIDNAFLYGDLNEVVYMKPPQGYYASDCNKVCRLKKSLYGLKQAPRQWNAKLTCALVENGFSQSKSDYSLFTKSDNGVFLALLVYVDDIIITGNDTSEIEKFKEFLRTKFMIKDLGNLKYFLGIEVINTDKGICLNQRKYVLDLLTDYGMLACKPARTPMLSKVSISNEATSIDPLLDNIIDYQKLMGKLIYLTNTRPDISYAVHCLSQFMHAPLKSHLRSAFKILRYLKGSPGLGIHITKASGMYLKAYSDADWAKCVVTRKSVTGYCIFINDNLISWKSKKQNTISKSSSEAGYIALASVTSEVIWVLKVLKDLGYDNLLPVSLFCDSKPAIKIDANPVFHERTKHFEIDLHFVREKILKGVIKTVKVESADQIADILTKGLDTIQHNKLFINDDENVTLISKLDVSNPLHLHPNDSAALTIVSFKLKGTENYHVWSNAMLLALKGRNKTSFIDGSCRRSNVDVVLGRQWDRVNAVVLGWILNSITEELFLGQIFSKRARHVWEELKETYDKVDGSVTFNLHHKIHTLKQNGSTLVDYYHSLNALWKQFDCLIELPRCTCHVADDFKKHNQLMKLMQFLMGLDDSYMSIRSSILSRDPLPDVRNAYATISSEESHRVVSSSMYGSSQRSQSAAFASNTNNSNMNRQSGGSGLVCENCGFNGHAIDRCFKLIGYPADFGKKRNGQNFKGKSVSNHSPSGLNVSSGFTDEQLSTLISFIKDKSISGKNVQANMAVAHPNGTETFISKIGSLKLPNGLILYDVLVIPEYCVTLISVHKLAKDNKIFVAFDESRCYFLNQDLNLKNVLGIGNQCGGLYYLDCEGINCNKSSVHIQSCLSQHDWHCRLGHPANPVLRVLKPELKIDNTKQTKYCETCQRAKQIREPFPLRGIPLRFWTECVLTATYLINRLPSSVLNGKSPFEMIYNTKPNLSKLRVFGCLCFATVLNNHDKLGSRSEKCVMMGYSSVKKGYRLYSLDKHQFIYSRDVKFFETVFPFKDSDLNSSVSGSNVFQDINHLNFFDLDYPEIPSDENSDDPSLNSDSVDHSDSSHSPVSGENDDTNDIPDSGIDADISDHFHATQDEQVTTLEENIMSEGSEDINPMTNSQGTQNLRRSSRQSVFPKNYNDFVVESKVKYGLEKFVGYAKLNTENLCFVTELNKSHEPKTFSEALRYSHWTDAMNKEMEALLRNDTWDLVDFPKDRKAISSKWLWKIKFKSSGEIERYKARFVALGCNQREGIDYEETFSLAIKMTTVRCLLNIVVLSDWPMFQLVIDNAFLYGDLNEVVYMKPPQGYYASDCNKVCRLKKSLYGLKQAPRQWNAKLTCALVENGFSQSKSDYSLFTKSDNGVFLA